jgi:hypothetical protein
MIGIPTRPDHSDQSVSLSVRLKYSRGINLIIFKRSLNGTEVEVLAEINGSIPRVNLPSAKLRGRSSVLPSIEPVRNGSPQGFIPSQEIGRLCFSARTVPGRSISNLVSSSGASTIPLSPVFKVGLTQPLKFIPPSPQLSQLWFCMPLNLVPEGPTFSGDNPERYWPFGARNSPLLNDPARGTHESLLQLIRRYAPHLKASFVNNEAWWSRNWGTPQVHVRTPNWEYLLSCSRPSRCLSTSCSRG